MFEEKTYENLLQNVLSNAPADIDTRQGSIFYDAVSGIMIKIAEFYTDLELIFSLSRVETATGEYLDCKASEYGVTRQSATYAQYFVEFTGTVPEIGERFFCDGMYFVLKKTSDNILFLEAEEGGTKYNIIQYGTAAVPVDTIEGLTSAVFGTIRSYAADTEDDESLRARVINKISGIGESGNKQHYKIWCESVDGVSKARIFPLWNGGNTVKAVLVNADGLPCSEAVTEAVQQFVDPDSLGKTVTIGTITYKVGDGLGEGAAPIGAHFTAVPAFESVITVSLKVEITDDTDISIVNFQITDIITKYFKGLALTGSDKSNTIVRISEIGALITTNIPDIIDFTELTLNGLTSNITVTPTFVPVLGGVTVEAV